MDRVKRFAGAAKGAPAAGPVRGDEDESLVLFGELYRHEKDKEKDVNLLEPMFSVEFEAIHGTSRKGFVHRSSDDKCFGSDDWNIGDGRMFKLPSGKRDYILPDGEKHDYDWLKTPPASPLFPSLEMEAKSSQMIFQKELPILQPVKTSRFWRKPDSTSTSAMSESPTSSSSKSVTPTTRPSSSSKKSLTKGAPAPSKEQDFSYRIDKRSSYTPLTNRLHNAFPAARTAKTTVIKPSGNKPAGSDNTNEVVNVAKPDRALKNVAATAHKKAPSNDSSSAGVKDLKAGVGKTRGLLRPPPATATIIGSNGKVQLQGVHVQYTVVATKGKGGAGTSQPAAGSTEAISKGRRRAGGAEEQRVKHGSRARK